MSYGCDHDLCKNCIEPETVERLRARVTELEAALRMVWDYLDRGGADDIEMAYKLDPVLRGSDSVSEPEGKIGLNDRAQRPSEAVSAALIDRAYNPRESSTESARQRTGHPSAKPGTIECETCHRGVNETVTVHACADCRERFRQRTPEAQRESYAARASEWALEYLDAFAGDMPEPWRSCTLQLLDEGKAECDGWRHVAHYFLGDAIDTMDAKEARAYAVKRTIEEGRQRPTQAVADKSLSTWHCRTCGHDWKAKPPTDCPRCNPCPTAPCFCGQKDGRHDPACSAHPRHRTTKPPPEPSDALRTMALRWLDGWRGGPIERTPTNVGALAAVLAEAFAMGEAQARACTDYPRPTSDLERAARVLKVQHEPDAYERTDVLDLADAFAEVRAEACSETARREGEP